MKKNLPDFMIDTIFVLFTGMIVAKSSEGMNFFRKKEQKCSFNGHTQTFLTLYETILNNII
jgi:hypothetical protein